MWRLGTGTPPLLTAARLRFLPLPAALGLQVSEPRAGRFQIRSQAAWRGLHLDSPQPLPPGGSECSWKEAWEGKGLPQPSPCSSWPTAETRAARGSGVIWAPVYFFSIISCHPQTPALWSFMLSLLLICVKPIPVLQPSLLTVVFNKEEVRSSAREKFGNIWGIY